jgi:N-acetylneuraminate synthase
MQGCNRSKQSPSGSKILIIETHMMHSIRLANHTLGPGFPCFIIAEAGVNHNGDPDLARQLVEVAVQAGANAVKFQTFKAERIVTSSAPKAEYQKTTTSAAESQYEMLRRLELSEIMHRDLMAICQQQDILFLSTPFDEDSADMLQALDIAAFKVPSGEITNLPLLAHIARKQQPMILSTGMAHLGEVDEAVRTIRQMGNEQLILLHCVSNYPADPADANLRAMQTMATAFHAPVGYSDHTPGIEVSLAAVALGACVIEKHFTLDRSLPGPDHRASLEPDELIALVRGIRTVEAALGSGLKQPARSEANTAAVARKSLVAASDSPAGRVLTREAVAIRRPGTGLPPSVLPHLLGRTVRIDITAGSLLELGMLA